MVLLDFFPLIFWSLAPVYSFLFVLINLFNILIQPNLSSYLYFGTLERLILTFFENNTENYIASITIHSHFHENFNKPIHL